MICLALRQHDETLLNLIEGDLGVSCIVATSLTPLIELLIQERLTAFVVDAGLLEQEPRIAEVVWSYAGATVSIIVDPSKQDAVTMLREIRNALLRRDRHRQQAKEEERARFSAAFADPLAAMLINLGIVLEDQKLARTTRIRIERVLHAAENMRAQLEPPAPRPSNIRPDAAPRPRLVKAAALTSAR